MALVSDVTSFAAQSGDGPPAPDAAVMTPDAPAASPDAAVPLELTPPDTAAPPTPAAPSLPADTDPAVTALCRPVAAADPCGPDLDLEGDSNYLNFFAQMAIMLPDSFFDLEKGTPHDLSDRNIPGQLAIAEPLLARTRDIRLLIMRSRLQILNRDLAGFAASLAAAAYWLETNWDEVHPRPENGEVIARLTAISALDDPTVIFPVQYAPLFDARRLGTVSYRRLMIANDEVKPRAGEEKLAVSAVLEARSETDPAALAARRAHIARLKSALDRIRNAFAAHGESAGLDNLPALVGRIQTFIDPEAAQAPAAADRADGSAEPGQAAGPAAAITAGPSSLAEASTALAAIADYYSRMEPSSPTLPLVRQAHQLIGKSFIEVMNILVPTQMDKAAFQIGNDQVFDLPVGRLSTLSQTSPAMGTGTPADGTIAPAAYSIQTRSQAITLLEQVQRFFRGAEPSSPVPMLCERARALAERDFMGVLRDVLPKAALKTVGADK